MPPLALRSPPDLRPLSSGGTEGLALRSNLGLVAHGRRKGDARGLSTGELVRVAIGRPFELYQ